MKISEKERRRLDKKRLKKLKLKKLRLEQEKLARIKREKEDNDKTLDSGVKDEKAEYITQNCPHCGQSVLIYKKELACRIFRHGVFKHNYKQMDPHEKKEECDRLVKEDKIFGCGKPFRIQEDDSITCCDYI